MMNMSSRSPPSWDERKEIASEAKGSVLAVTLRGAVGFHPDMYLLRGESSAPPVPCNNYLCESTPKGVRGDARLCAGKPLDGPGSHPAWGDAVCAPGLVWFVETRPLTLIRKSPRLSHKF